MVHYKEMAGELVERLREPARTTRLHLEVTGKIGKVGLKILTSSFMCLNDQLDAY